MKCPNDERERRVADLFAKEQTQLPADQERARRIMNHVRRTVAMDSVTALRMFFYRLQTFLMMLYGIPRLLPLLFLQKVVKCARNGQRKTDS